MNFLSYIFFRFWVALFSIIPFPILYLLSDGMAWFMENIFRYRRTVISKNLDLAFPEYSENQKRTIRKSSYRNLTDIILESFKAFSMSPNKIKHRYIIEKPAFIDGLFKEKKNLVVFASHTANWEWATYTFPLYYQYDIIGMIKPVKNKYINNFTNRKRCSTGTKVINIYNQKDRKILSNPEKPFMLVYIADQNPSDDKQSLIVDFFDTKTHTLHGFEKTAKQNDWPVVHLITKRISRGKYSLSPIIITETPKTHPKGEISQICFSQLEQVIQDNPGDWLWTHKRWKRNIHY